MPNKNTFKELYSNKINKDKNYQMTIKKIENSYRKKSILKKVLVPVTSLIIIFGLIYLNINENSDILKTNDKVNTSSKDFDIYINDVDNYNNSFSLDLDIQMIEVNYKDIVHSPSYSFLIHINIPNDLENKSYYAIYTKENKDGDYTLLHNYKFIYQNENNDREVIISFSDKYEPLRDYIIDDAGNSSKINNTEVIIYQNDNTYIVTFIYNNINFDIETRNITEKELLGLLLSILI